MMNLANQKRKCGVRAFSLIEVLLAVGIIAGLLGIVLFFYQQAAHLRTELLLETERISAARLLIDRLTTELRAARTHNYYAVPLVGSSSYLQFITTALPSQLNWSGERFGRITRPESDLKLVSYNAGTLPEDTNAVGLTRSEETLVEFRTVAASEATLAPSESTNDTGALLITDQFQFVRFRFWDGYDWLDSWNETFLPKGVEISLGAQPLPPEIDPAEYPHEVFRRVIHIPASVETPDDPLFELMEEPTAQTAEVAR